MLPNDQGNNLLQVNLPNGNEIRYTVDALNRRVAKMTNGTYEYKLLYSGQLSPTCRPKSCTKVPTARLDADDRVLEEYVYGSVADLSAAQLWQVEGYGPQVGTRINVPDYIIKDGTKYRVITDHRGSVRFVVDTHSGEVMQETEYTEFGQIISETLAEDWEPVIFGYAGGLQDRDTGLVRFGARDYDPETARWTSKEPLGFNGSNNFYVYAENDPVNLVDVSGLAPGDVFATPEDAAKDALSYSRKQFGNSKEVGGIIYKIYDESVCSDDYFNNTSYSYTAPDNLYQGNQSHHVEFLIPGEFSLFLEGLYHTHVLTFDDTFSSTDIKAARHYGVKSYLGTPVQSNSGGAVKVYDPYGNNGKGLVYVLK